MARPKEKPTSWSSAFEERCAKEQGRLRQKLVRELRDDMLRLLEQGTESDLTVLTPGGQLDLHRCIIKQRCPQLLTELLDDPAEGSTVKLHNLNLNTFKKVIRYVYSEDDLDPIHEDLRQLILQRGLSLQCQQNSLKSANANTLTADVIESYSNGEVNGNFPSTDELDGNIGTLLDTEGVCDRPAALSREGDCEEPCSTARTVESPSSSVGSVTNGDVKDGGKEDWEGDREAASGLAEDLLEMLRGGEDTDVVITAGNKSVRCHRCILSARCDYFAAMLGGSWKESSATQIELEGLSEFALDHLVEIVYGKLDTYSSSQCPLVELVAISDMYAVHGLKQLTGFVIRRDQCHFFHKPCTTCLQGTVEVLPLLYMYQMTELCERTLKWITRHFVRLWPLKQFSGLPEEIRQKSLEATIGDITSDSVLEVIIDCDCLMGSLSNVRWSEPVVVMAKSLMEACIQHLRLNMAAVVTTVKFNSLGSTMALGLSLLEDVFSRAILTMPREKICESYHAVHKLREYSESELCIWNLDFRKLVETLNCKCEHYVRLHVNYVVHTPEWNTVLTPEMQEKIKEGVWYVCVGDTGPVRPPPKLSSTRDAAAKRANRNGARPKTASDVSSGDARKPQQRAAQSARGRGVTVTTTQARPGAANKNPAQKSASKMGQSPRSQSSTGGQSSKGQGALGQSTKGQGATGQSSTGGQSSKGALSSKSALNQGPKSSVAQSSNSATSQASKKSLGQSSKTPPSQGSRLLGQSSKSPPSLGSRSLGQSSNSAPKRKAKSSPDGSPRSVPSGEKSATTNTTSNSTTDSRKEPTKKQGTGNKTTRPHDKLDTSHRASGIPVLSPPARPPVSFLSSFTGPLPLDFCHLERLERDCDSLVSFQSNQATVSVNSNFSTPSSVTPLDSECGSDIYDPLSPADHMNSAETLPLIPVSDLRTYGLIFIEDGFIPLLTWQVQLA